MTIRTNTSTRNKKDTEITVSLEIITLLFLQEKELALLVNDVYDFSKLDVKNLDIISLP